MELKLRDGGKARLKLHYLLKMLMLNEFLLKLEIIHKLFSFASSVFKFGQGIRTFIYCTRYEVLAL